MTNEETPEEFFKSIAKIASLPKGTDESICFALAEGDGWFGNLLADGQYISPNGDLAADYHEFCRINSLETSEIDNAKHFLKQFKLQQKMSKINEDFE